MTLTFSRPQEARVPTPDTLPRVLLCPDREAAWRQYWRHAANAAVFAILTHRNVELLPSLHQQASVQPGTRPPNPDPAAPETDQYSYVVEVPRVILQLPESKPLHVSRLSFILSIWPHAVDEDGLPIPRFSEGQRLILRFLLETPRAQSERVLLLHAAYLYEYHTYTQQYRRRSGQSGDLPWLMEYLLAPHAPDLIAAMDLPGA